MNFDDKVKHYQELFGLQNWTIIIQKNPVDLEDRNAKTLADPRYNKAVITVYPGLLANPQIWDEIVIHELIHLVMALYDMYVDNFTEFNKIKEDTAQEIYFGARESAVSQLTSIIMRTIK